MDDSGPCAAVAAAALLLLFGAAAGTEPLATEENSSSYSSSYSGRSGLPADGIGLFGRLQLLADDLAGDLAPLHLHPHTRPISLASLKMQLQGSIHGRDAATMSIQDSSNSIHLGIDKSNLRWSRRWRWRWRAGLKSRTTPRCCRPAASATFPDRWSGLSTGAGTSSPPTYPAPPKAPAKPNQSIRFVDPSVSNTILRKASVLRIRMDDGQDGQGGQDGRVGQDRGIMTHHVSRFDDPGNAQFLGRFEGQLAVSTGVLRVQCLEMTESQQTRIRIRMAIFTGVKSDRHRPATAPKTIKSNRIVTYHQYHQYYQCWGLIIAG